MDAIEMLDQLRKDWDVEVYTHPDSGDAVVELYELDERDSMCGRYVEPRLPTAIARAWAGEPADG